MPVELILLAAEHGFDAARARWGARRSILLACRAAPTDTGPPTEARVAFTR
jgi:hypothetical protein